jgi:hypothetical protein
MKQHNTYINKFRNRQAERRLYGMNGDLCNGCFIFPQEGYNLQCIASNGGGWDHVSVSRSDDQVPTWDDMCKIKDLFFAPEETVVQFHPKQSEYINHHPGCLHLWRKQGEEYELPPSIYVGPKA